MRHKVLSKLLRGRYQVVQLLSAGGFCQTYLAKDTYQPDHPICVVKHLLPISNYPESLQTLKRLFIREAEALKKLDCYHQVPQLLDHFEENQEFYLVQEFIEGRPLSTELQRGFYWSESFVVQMLQEVLGILQGVHCHGLIHSDVKPSNLIRRKQDDRLVLIDFGSVKQAWTQVLAQEKTNTTFAQNIPATITFGTPGYMPAEQVRGLPRLNSDIYALGMIAIQGLTGLHPKQLLEDSDTGEIVWQHQANVSAELACILNKMVRYHFKERYQSAAEVLEALQPLATLYQPIEHPGFCQQKATSAQLAETTKQELPVLLPEQDTTPFVWDEYSSEGLLDNNASDATHPTLPNKSILLMGMGIGVASVLTLTLCLYYLLQSPAPTSNIPIEPIFYPNQKSL